MKYLKLKKVFRTLFVLYIFLILSNNVVAKSSIDKKEQMTWGSKVMTHVKRNWKPTGNKKGNVAKVKVTISRKGLISKEIEISCKGSLSFCASVTNTLISSEPFPAPPKNAKKLDRTITLSFG